MAERTLGRADRIKTLYLMRHAKSSWDDPELADHDRPLNQRGRRAAARMGGYLRQEGADPQLVLCSAAVRARQTLEAMAGELGGGVSVAFEEDLYGAGAEDLMIRIRAVPDGVDRLLLIGHNPGVHDLVHGLTGDGDPAAMARLRSEYPTAAVATLTVPGPWAALSPGTARLLFLVVPRELDEDGGKKPGR